MKSSSRVWLGAALFIMLHALVPSGSLFAQQTAGTSTSPQASQAIDQLTGPIALYPDPLIFQILPASTNVETLKSFAGWMGKNANLKGSELQDAAQKAGFDASLVALAPFPQVIQMMVQKPDWTKALGQAFTADKDAIFDSIQRLRYPAKYAFSGVMTFMVGQDGVVYQKDLGEDTAAQAPRLAEFDPDNSWTAVQVP